MIHLLYEPLPDAVTVGGVSMPVLTDFREWLRFAALMRDKDCTAYDKLMLLPEWFIEPPRTFTGDMLRALRWFYDAADLEPEQKAVAENPAPRRPPTFDWTVDAKFVLADFRRFYGIDLMRTEFLHWWEFRALFSALPPESMTVQRIDIRRCDLSKIKDQKRRAQIARIQRQIALPFGLDDGDIADVFDSV
jgi:hypothetical protein